LREEKAGCFGSAFFCEFQIEINTIIIYKNHLVAGEVLIPLSEDNFLVIFKSP
jgi:hypothetical protein